jgi:hypothetical protein
VHFPSSFVASEKSRAQPDAERRAFTITRRRFEKLRARSLFTGDEREQLRAGEVAIAIAWRAFAITMRSDVVKAIVLIAVDASTPKRSSLRFTASAHLAS